VCRTWTAGRDQGGPATWDHAELPDKGGKETGGRADGEGREQRDGAVIRAARRLIFRRTAVRRIAGADRRRRGYDSPPGLQWRPFSRTTPAVPRSERSFLNTGR
jgi:hypothetical protein